MVVQQYPKRKREGMSSAGVHSLSARELSLSCLLVKHAFPPPHDDGDEEEGVLDAAIPASTVAAVATYLTAPRSVTTRHTGLPQPAQQPSSSEGSARS